MPIKITLFAENAVTGSALIEHALAEGIALGEFVEVAPPIKVKVPKVRHRVTRQRKMKRAGVGQLFKLSQRRASTAPGGSVEGRAFTTLSQANREMTQKQMYALLKRKGMKAGSTKNAVLKLRSAKVLVPA